MAGETTFPANVALIPTARTAPAAESLDNLDGAKIRWTPGPGENQTSTFGAWLIANDISQADALLAEAAFLKLNPQVGNVWTGIKAGKDAKTGKPLSYLCPDPVAFKDDRRAALKKFVKDTPQYKAMGDDDTYGRTASAANARSAAAKPSAIGAPAANAQTAVSLRSPGAVPVPTGETKTQAQKDAEAKKAIDGINQVKKVSEASTWSKVFEVIETIFRWVSPIFNLAMLMIRLMRWAWWCFQKGANWITEAVFHKQYFHPAKIDWGTEFVRALGDVAGVIYPPAGALAHIGLDYWFGKEHAEHFGGLNYAGSLPGVGIANKVLSTSSEFLGIGDVGVVIGSKVDSEYAFAPEIDAVGKWVKGAAKAGFNAVTGADIDQGVAPQPGVVPQPVLAQAAYGA